MPSDSLLSCTDGQAIEPQPFRALITHPTAQPSVQSATSDTISSLSNLTRALNQQRRKPTRCCESSAAQVKRRKARTAQQGADVQLVLQLKLREAALGAKKDLVAKVMRPCVVCVGLGAEPGSIIQECTVCRGVGEVTKFTGGSAGVNSFTSSLHNDSMMTKDTSKRLI